MNRKKIVSAILISLVFVAAGIFVWKIKSVSQPEQITQTTEQPIKNDGIENIKDLIDGEYVFAPIDTSDWQTYKNEQHEYGIRFPKNWVINKSDPKHIVLNSKENEGILEKIKRKEMYGEGYASDIYINYYSSVSEEPENLLNQLEAKTIDELVERNELISKVEKVKFANETAWVVVKGGFGAYLTIFVEHNNHLYEVMFGNKEKINDLSQVDYQILDSFSFLE